MLHEIAPDAAGICISRLDRVSKWLEKQVASSKLAGCSVLIGRKGGVAYYCHQGMADVEHKKPFARDTIVRIYSMTKPVTAVAAMMLYERGAFQIDDRVSSFLPEFSETQVWRGGDVDNVEPQKAPMLIRDLLTHTSGLTYGWMQNNSVDEKYRADKIDEAFHQSPNHTLETATKQLASVPLLAQPGTQWNYSLSYDVLGRLIEIWSGQSLSEFFSNEIFAPLEMKDTGFNLPYERKERFSALYFPEIGSSTPGSPGLDGTVRGGLKLEESYNESAYFNSYDACSGGGGLVSTVDDYAAFCQMLLNGGELNGNRLLGRKTVEYMRMNHLKDGKDMAGMGQPVWSETSYDGIGFGLGFAVVLDPVKAAFIASVGEHHWGGLASTFFWLDPEEDLFTIFFTQLMPSSTYPIRRELRTRVYQALVD